MDRTTAARFLTPTILALLAALFGVLWATSPRSQTLETRVRRGVRLRLAVVFGLVSLFLFWLQSR